MTPATQRELALILLEMARRPDTRLQTQRAIKLVCPDYKLPDDVLEMDAEFAEAMQFG